MQSILILGAKGTLGGQLRRLYPDALAWDRNDVDATNFAALEDRIKSLDPAPRAIVNCIAFNDVDGAEEQKDAAVRLNTVLPWNLAALTTELEIPLVHFSTNYVFDGAAGEYDESAQPSPLSIYGKTKARGELGVANANPRHYIVRTSVIFGPKGESDLSKRSFIDLMLDLARRTDTVRAVEDEVNSITYAPDLAAGVRMLLEEGRPFGTYHISNEGGVSWYELAREVFGITGQSVTVLPVPSTAFPRKARRPSRAVLVNTKLPPFRPWRDAVAEFLRSSAS